MSWHWRKREIGDTPGTGGGPSAPSCLRLGVPDLLLNYLMRMAKSDQQKRKVRILWNSVVETLIGAAVIAVAVDYFLSPTLQKSLNLK